MAPSICIDEIILDIGLPQGMQHGLETATVLGTVKNEKGASVPDATVTLVAAYNLEKLSGAN